MPLYQVPTLSHSANPDCYVFSRVSKVAKRFFIPICLHDIAPGIAGTIFMSVGLLCFYASGQLLLSILCEYISTHNPVYLLLYNIKFFF